jgi:tripeptide aminopeptidase
MTRRCAWGWVLVLGVLNGGAAEAQQQPADLGVRLMQDAAVKAAVQAAKDDEAQTIEDQVRLCEVPAPPFKETERGKVYADEFRRLGLKNVRIDKAGNVLGERTGLAADPHLVFTAHLDTVFPEGTNVRSPAKAPCSAVRASATIAAGLRSYWP